MGKPGLVGVNKVYDDESKEKVRKNRTGYSAWKKGNA